MQLCSASPKCSLSLTLRKHANRWENNRDRHLFIAEAVLKKIGVCPYYSLEKIDKWLKGEEKLPRFKEMNELIEKCEDLKSINRVFNRDNRYKHIRDRCNDHTHSNYFQYMQLNSKINIQNAKVYIDKINDDLLDLIVLHFAYLFTLNGHYMASSNYIDCLELNIEPEEDSQYWVAPFIQEFFDKFVKIRRPDISKEIINDTFMDLK